ncbi:MAG TPA: ArsC family reductase [Chitinophagaceae bacterium]|nr:ArsC family reductase [Chitinophagaceae bacterium]
MYTIYGIPNCDTVKKVLNWMKERNIHYQFHDYKTMGITAKELKSWCDQVGWETIFNKRSTTYKELLPAIQASVTNASKAIPLMIENTSIIKRPVITKADKVILVGFDAKKYDDVLGR